MQKTTGMSLVAALLIAGPLAAQEPDAPAAAAPEQAPQAAEVERAAAAEPAPAAGAEAVPAEPQPPEDPAGQLLARFSFDAGMTPDGAESGPGLAAAFRRASPVAHDGAALAIDAPRFTDGRAGKGLLLESAGANLFSPAQAGADDLSQFQALNGASLSLVSDQAWEGERCLSISVPGEAEGEGVSVEAPADKALYLAPRDDNDLNASYTMADAVFSACFLNALLRNADIVGINADLRTGKVDGAVVASMSAEAVDAKVGWVEEAAAAAGRSEAIELNVRSFMNAIGDDVTGAVDFIAQMAQQPAEMVAESPFTLIGPPSKLVDDLMARRARWGFSYVIVGQDEVATFAPVVEALAGK